MSIRLGAKMGEGFVTADADGVLTGPGSYCGEFPVIYRLTPETRGGKVGFRVTVHMAPLEPRVRE